MSQAKSSKARATKPQVAAAVQSESDSDCEVTPVAKRQKTDKAEKAFSYFLDLQDRLDESNRQKEVLEEKVGDLEGQSMHSQLELARVQHELADVKRDLQHAADQADGVIETLQAQLAAAQEAQQADRQALVAAQAQLQAQQPVFQEVTNLTAENLSLKSELEEVRGHIFKIPIRQAQDVQEPLTLRAHLQGLQDQLLQLPVLEAIAREASGLQELVPMLQAQVQGLQGQLSAAQAEHATGANIVKQIACLLATHPVVAAGLP